MTRTKKIALKWAGALCLFLIFSWIAVPAQADPGSLNGHADVLPKVTTGLWTGSVDFDNTGSPTFGNLKGTLDYAVFLAADFNAHFGNVDYTPGDAVVYTYQVTNTGSDAISAQIIGVVNAANTIGSFNIGDVQPSSAALTPNATWGFLATVNGAILTNETSWGLAFSSPNQPMDGVSLTIDGGTSILSVGVPTPSATAIPEPASLLLLAIGGAGLFWLRRQR